MTTKMSFKNVSTHALMVVVMPEEKTIYVKIFIGIANNTNMRFDHLRYPFNTYIAFYDNTFNTGTM